MDKHREAALLGTTVEAVESELDRRGVEYGASVADHIAGRAVFEQTKAEGGEV